MSLPVNIKPQARDAVLRTSDRIQYLGCRRRWAWSSHLRDNLGPKQVGNPLWLGAGFHYALEDYYGEKLYGTPSKAFMAFIYAYNETYRSKVPDDWRDLAELGCAMLDYYPLWLVGRDPLPNYVHDGKPQLEVNVKIPISMGLLKPYCDDARFERICNRWDTVCYSMQFDRVHIDEHGHLWVVEYKTAKTMQTSHFLVDPQIRTYIWGATHFYDKHVQGVIYQQHRKDLPKPPRVLQNGSVSTAQNQRTSHRLYRDTLIKVYGEVKKAPNDNIKYLNQLSATEGENADDFIRRDKVFCNSKTSQATAQQILQSAVEMLDPELPLYPNPVRMCASYCPFMGPCISKDDGSDWKYDLEMEMEERPEGYDGWRENLPDPETFKGVIYQKSTTSILTPDQPTA